MCLQREEWLLAGFHGAGTSVILLEGVGGLSTTFLIFEYFLGRFVFQLIYGIGTDRFYVMFFRDNFCMWVIEASDCSIVHLKLVIY